MLACWVCGTCLVAHAGPLVTTESPIGFFTNVASRLLKSELNLDLNRIQLYPTNQYTPSVHRLLQVTANLYDAITNRTITDYPYLPTVFRPLFTNEGGVIYISGYVEEIGINVLDAPIRDLQSAADRSELATTDMVCGVPLVIGAKKGFPNFNKFVMHSQVQVTRKLQFHRLGTSNTAQVNEIDQMFVVTVTNVLGVQAWNSYVTTFPRDLRIVVLADLTVTLTNAETGKLLNSEKWRYTSPVVVTNISASSWQGYDPAREGLSFVLPLASGAGVPYSAQLFLSNSTYQLSSDSFVPLTGSFERTPGTTNFYIPHWQLGVRTRLRVALIDTSSSPNRIVDYVNLDSTEQPVDVMSALSQDAICGDVYTPNGSRSAMWCTNRLWGSPDLSHPTFGIMNQIEASLGHIDVDWNGSINEFPAGMTKYDAIAFFKGQFNPSYLRWSNTFNAPFQPYRRLYLVTSWEANDPLVHYTLSDLRSSPDTNRLWLDIPPMYLSDELGEINYGYQPWRGNPKFTYGPVPPYDPTLKDPSISRSDGWNFPTNAPPDLAWLGRVHRGTPWQTIYLKSSCPSLALWMQWTGDSQLLTNQNGVFLDASFTQPTNDWHLASLLVSLLNTNDLLSLPPVNQISVPAWCGILNGLTALTNDLPDDQLPYYPPVHLTPVAMASNSPQAVTIAAALVAARAAEPDHLFHGVGDILATPELSLASPWLNTSSEAQLQHGISDEAYEAIPSQFLPLLHPDSIASISQSGGTLRIEFTGVEGYAYTVQTSTNLLDWTTVSTNYPVSGSFSFVASPPPNCPRRFYRSVLQP
jgi:hypothetical protein